MKCNECNHEVGENDNFCGNCGVKLHEYCPHCFVENKDNYSCGGCCREKGENRMNNSLYEITGEYLRVLDNLEIDEETGEILNADELDSIAGAFEEKSENLACYIKNCDAFIANLKAEEANLAKRREGGVPKGRVDGVHGRCGAQPARNCAGSLVLPKVGGCEHRGRGDSAG